MSRCPHCNKLTHSENLCVYFIAEDHDKVAALTELENWTPRYMYINVENSRPTEYGKLKCGDIYIHFIAVTKKRIKDFIV